MATVQERVASLESERQHMVTKADLRATEIRLMAGVMMVGGIVVGAIRLFM